LAIILKWVVSFRLIFWLKAIFVMVYIWAYIGVHVFEYLSDLSNCNHRVNSVEINSQRFSLVFIKVIMVK
jgi:hypothetical protein